MALFIYTWPVISLNYAPFVFSFPPLAVIGPNLYWRQHANSRFENRSRPIASFTFSSQHPYIDRVVGRDLLLINAMSIVLSLLPFIRDDNSLSISQLLHYLQFLSRHFFKKIFLSTCHTWITKLSIKLLPFIKKKYSFCELFKICFNRFTFCKKVNEPIHMR